MTPTIKSCCCQHACGLLTFKEGGNNIHEAFYFLPFSSVGTKSANTEMTASWEKNDTMETFPHEIRTTRRCYLRLCVYVIFNRLIH